MPTEPRNQHGYIRAITGCMFSGKTEAGSQYLKRALVSKKKSPVVFVPSQAKRIITINVSNEELETDGKMVSRNGFIIEAIEFPANNPNFILNYVLDHPEITTIFIDEIHFCSSNLVDICKILANELKLEVTVMGLDQNFSEEGFGPMPALMVEAEFVEKSLAVCTDCGNDYACKSWLDSRSRNQVTDNDKLAGDRQYVAVCRACFQERIKKYGPPKK